MMPLLLGMLEDEDGNYLRPQGAARLEAALESKRREWAMENTTPLGKRPRYVTLTRSPSSPTLDAVGEAAAATPHRTAPPSAPSCPPSP